MRNPRYYALFGAFGLLLLATVCSTAQAQLLRTGSQNDDSRLSSATNRVPDPPSNSPLSDQALEEFDPVALEQGPVHEAFAAPIGEAGGIAEAEQAAFIEQAPPEPIDELPPEQRPEGTNVQWIPGYWMWSPAQEDFVWISGVWRAVPSGRSWTPGSWVQTEEGYLWSGGFWIAEQATEVRYLPEPPQSLEQGPSSPSPSDGHFWVPGCWIYKSASYRWRPGYWYQEQPNWVWVPSYYNPTPQGYIYVSGYWDYPLASRGVLYAPVYWPTRGYQHVGYHYRPRSVVNTNLLIANLFINSGRHHYYYGDYSGYRGQGYSSWFRYASFGNHSGVRRSHRYYDPLYQHYRWNQRGHNGRTFQDLRQVYRRFDRDRLKDGSSRGRRDQRSNSRDRGSRLIADSYQKLPSTGTRSRMRSVDQITQRIFLSDRDRYQSFQQQRSRLEARSTRDERRLSESRGRGRDSVRDRDPRRDTRLAIEGLKTPRRSSSGSINTGDTRSNRRGNVGNGTTIVNGRSTQAEALQRELRRRGLGQRERGQRERGQRERGQRELGQRDSGRSTLSRSDRERSARDQVQRQSQQQNQILNELRKRRSRTDQLSQQNSDQRRSSRPQSRNRDQYRVLRPDREESPAATRRSSTTGRDSAALRALEQRTQQLRAQQLRQQNSRQGQQRAQQSTLRQSTPRSSQRQNLQRQSDVRQRVQRQMQQQSTTRAPRQRTAPTIGPSRGTSPFSRPTVDRQRRSSSVRSTSPQRSGYRGVPSARTRTASPTKSAAPSIRNGGGNNRGAANGVRRSRGPSQSNAGRGSRGPRGRGR